MDASNLMVTLMGVVKLNEPQHKNKCQESGRGPGRQEELRAGGEVRGEQQNAIYTHRKLSKNLHRDGAPIKILKDGSGSRVPLSVR